MQFKSVWVDLWWAYPVSLSLRRKSLSNGHRLPRQAINGYVLLVHCAGEHALVDVAEFPQEILEYRERLLRLRALLTLLVPLFDRDLRQVRHDFRG